MTSIAILGSGRVARALAAKLHEAGHAVVVGSRDPDAAAQAWEGPSVTITGAADAVRDADVVVNATPGDSAVDRLGQLKDELDGKILVDVSNATVRGADGMPGGLVYPESSLAEHLQEALPGTRVVKTLNTMLFMVMTAPTILSAPPVAFLSGDDDEAKATVRGLLGDLGWPEEQVLDLGGIRTARGPEAMMLLVPDVMKARGFAPFAISIVA
jgi:predicted dinucleotide-binding enzyme